ncbi:MAG TPA: alcohol dehydrogenase catalytic domain-containing protein [Actinomycetota bacterium]|nr:alcohol dehydrogenase catalytic domain-containing protein [Actinomycetota bacterium]
MRYPSARTSRPGRIQLRALTIDGYGLDAVALREVPDPAPGPGEVTVAVRAAAFNHLDLWTLRGALKIEHRFPHALGADGAGVVAAVGDSVPPGIHPGDRVLINPALSCGTCERCRSGEQSECSAFRMLGEHEPGTVAELVRVPAGNVFPIPEHLDFAEAAALGVTFITAYRMLFDRGAMKPGEWVLVTGIGGGLALSLFQLARPVAGKLFVTSSSGDKLARAAGLGADGGVNYREDDVGRAVRRLTGKRGVDLVADSAGGSSLDGSLRALRKGGRVVIAGATAGAAAEVDVRRVFWNQLSIVGSTMGSVANVSDMLRLVAGSKLRPIVDRVVGLEGAADALRTLDEGGQFGKIVVQVSP